MFGWLKGIYNGAGGVLSSVEKWIMGALTTVYSYFNNLISQLWSGLQQLANTLNNYIYKLEQSLYSLYTLAQWIITKGIPQLADWALGELQKLYDYARSVYNWAVKEIAWLEAWAQSELNKVVQWVLKNIWDPLWNAISGVIKWVENEGAFVYYLLTHPDKLAALIGQYLLAEWMNLSRKYAKSFVRWLAHNMIAEIPSISSVIEDIVASLF